MKYPFFSVMDARCDESQSYIHFAHQQSNPPISLVQFGHHKTVKGYGYGPMVRDHYLIHFVASGNGFVDIGDMEWRIQAGQCFALCPHQMGYYEADIDSPWEYYWIGYEGVWAEELMKQIGFSKENPVISIPFPEKVFCYMKEMSESEMSAQNALYFNGMMQLVLSVMTSEVAIPPELVSNHRRIMNYMGNQYVTMLKSMIENSYSERLSVDTLARRLGFNRSYLTNLFKQHTGMSIKQYILDVRMQQAILRLQMNKLSVQQIALECGFSDALYFSRLFKKRFGVSPSMYCCVIEESDCENDMEM